MTEYTYYPDGNLKTVTDPEQKTTTYTYDALGRVKMVEDHLRQDTTYAYDAAGNLRSLTDANSQTSGLSYNGLGQVTGETRPLGESTTYSYNASGKLETKTDANGQRTEYVYEDGTNLLTDIYYVDSSDTQTGHVSFTYERGQLSGYDDGTVSATYAYNAFGQKLSETVNYPDFSKTSSYTYDNSGQKRSFTMPDGSTVSYTYNDNNGLEDIRIPGVGNISYPSYTLGRPDSMSSPGDTRSYAYDALARLDSLDSSTLEYSYSYDDVGNILTKTTEHGSYVYDYDDVYRLTDVDNPTLDDEAYTYDGVGNRETATNATGTITHNANNELEVYGDISFAYDANGNMVSKTSASESWAYTYNVQNRLIQVEEDDLLIAEYGYDPFGRRLWKEVDGERTYFLYSDEGLVAEYDASGAEIRSYGYKPDSTWTTDLLWLKEGGSYYWYQNDHLGTPQKLVDVNGTVVWSAQYSSFGEAVVDVETVENNLRFPGQYTDAETGLYYNYFRYYDPRIGRYLRVDPIGFDGGVNLFSYSLNNPVNAIDVFALETAVIITKSLYGPLWIGDHAAVRIDFPGISEGELGADMPKLFDPGGGYYKDNQNKEMQGSAILGWYDSAEADLWPFIQYHLEDNEVSWVIVHYFETTPEEEACIFENMELADPGAEFLCAKSTYGAIAGCGPFSDLKKALTLETPGGLDKKLQNIGIPHKRVIYLDTLHMLPLLLELGFSDMLQFYQYGTLPGGVPIS